MIHSWWLSQQRGCGLVYKNKIVLTQRCCGTKIQEEEEKELNRTEKSSYKRNYIGRIIDNSRQGNMASVATVDSARDRGLQDYRKKLLEHKEVESRLKESK